MDIRNKVEICKMVTHAILSDACITDSEREFLGKLMDRYAIGEADRKEILSCNIGDDLSGHFKNLDSNEEARNELLVELALAVAADGEISSSERALLGRVADALHISEEDLNLMLEAAIA